MLKSLLAILLIACYAFALGQDTLSIDSLKEKDKFGVRVKDKFNFINKIEFLNHIQDSKSQCDEGKFEFTCSEDHNGKIIRAIYIETLDPFGHIDTSQVKRPKIYKLANSLHQSTPERIIRQFLLFKEGDKVSQKDLYESGNLLHESQYFRDAQFAIIPDETDPNVVDVYILTQDLWSWSFWGELSDRFVGGGLGFDKFAGLPQRLSAGLKFNFDKRNPVTPFVYYNFRNIKGSFIDATAFWSHDWRDYKYELSLKRGFFSSKPQWAFAGQIGWYRNLEEQFNEQSFSNKQDFWLARSFPFKFKNHDYLNVVVAGRVLRKKFTATPEYDVIETHDYNFMSNNSYLFAIGIANRYYVKEDNIFDFYEYRNLPSGFNMHLIGGIIDNTNHAYRGYFGVTANHSLMTCAGYFQEEIGTGTYFDNGVEQLTFQIKSKYFTHKIPLKQWGLRQYIYQSLALGFLRPNNAGLNLSNTDIKGLRQNYHGNSYYSLNLETEIYSPIRFMGFQARIFVFADLGIQGNQSNVPLGGGRLHHAYGFGARLNNWKLGIGYLELAIVYYPNTNGILNNPLEISQHYYNSKVIESNSLYNQEALSTVY